MNVLSLFDGISCGAVALERAGIYVDHYISSEVDKYAIAVSNKNHPNIIQVGDVTKWRTWNLHPTPDLIIGGSPCQGFSFAGKQLNFEDPRSKLFFEFVNIVNHYKPKYFLLENVRMKKEYQDVISKALGVEPICINSSLVSAQNRVRYYWTNIPNVTQPEDREICLKDIIEDGVCDRDKSFCVDANYWKGGNLKSYFEKHRRQLVFRENWKPGSIVGRRLDSNGTRKDHEREIKPIQTLEVYNGDKSHALTTVQKDTAIATLRPGRYELAGERRNFPAQGGDMLSTEFSVNNYYRKLTPIECERLQTLPDNYTEGVSNTQRYRMLGNGWTVDVLAHIFKGLL